jgi:hypothetical protein
MAAKPASKTLRIGPALMSISQETTKNPTENDSLAEKLSQDLTLIFTA